MGSTRFRNPRALSSALATLGTLRPRALGFLNPVDPMDSISNLYIVETALMPIDAVIPLRALRRVAECQFVRRCHHPLTARSNIAPKHCSMTVSSTCIFMTFRRIRGEIHPHSKPHPRWDMCCNKFLIKSSLADSTDGTHLFIAQFLWFRYVTLQNCALEILFYVW